MSFQSLFWRLKWRQTHHSAVEIPAVSTKEERILFGACSGGDSFGCRILRKVSPRNLEWSSSESSSRLYEPSACLYDSSKGSTNESAVAGVSERLDPGDYDKCSGRFEPLSHQSNSKWLQRAVHKFHISSCWRIRDHANDGPCSSLKSLCQIFVSRPN